MAFVDLQKDSGNPRKCSENGLLPSDIFGRPQVNFDHRPSEVFKCLRNNFGYLRCNLHCCHMKTALLLSQPESSNF